ncbi:predicted protein [Naegleria gruberi]|uniref:Predicted protein n=1 Tax=Naegleria gruberi TaxID=5762 RepID=D2V1W5_NAEGR|nr:uncharacterized protein NAEGRDRAFT_62719 [Naegleria gruberi]EFC49233.1 predicted protein [Naegleria gruberi]|eukprot:XP_002681977.1 predicted protein [Naegleria gruberi strain NEG-M]
MNTTTSTGHTRQPQSTIANKYISPLYLSAISKKPNKAPPVKEIPKHKVDSFLQSTIEVKSITHLKDQQSKHVRYNLDPREKYKYPVTSNQEFGWLTSTPSTTLNKENEKFEQTFNNMSHSTREAKYNQSNVRENRKFNFPCSHTDIVKYRNNMILNNHF